MSGHTHRYHGQTLTHEHDGGRSPHGWYGHAEDPAPGSFQAGEVYERDGAEVRPAWPADTSHRDGGLPTRPAKQIELRRPRHRDEGYDYELCFTSPGGSGTSVERLTDDDLAELRRVIASPPD